MELLTVVCVKGKKLALLQGYRLAMASRLPRGPILAIVGTAFLVVLSMQIWSNTLKKSDAKAVSFLWSGLLFTGSICALINAALCRLQYERNSPVAFLSSEPE